MSTFDLDPYEVGQKAIGLYLASMQLRHVRPAETIRYLHPESREGQFVADLFELDNDQLRLKYGLPSPALSPAPTKPVEPGWGKLKNRRKLRSV